MSFILDALRKSEAERQRGTMPGLADARLRPRGAVRSLWLPVVAIALLANVLVLSFQWLRAPAEAVAPVDRVIPGKSAPTMTPAPTGVSEPLPVTSAEPSSREVRPLALENATARPRARAPATPPIRSRETVRATSSAPVAEESASAVEIADANLPTADQLALTGITLPRLKLELHVYSSDAASRFVFINTAKYREGTRLKEGPLIEAITSDGVVLDYEGRRFVLPRQ